MAAGVSVASGHRSALRAAAAAGSGGGEGAIVEVADGDVEAAAMASRSSVTATVLKKVSEEQVMLLNRLARLDQAITATIARAAADKLTAEKVQDALKDLGVRAETAKVNAQGTQTLVEQTKASQTEDTKKTEATLKQINETVNITEKETEKLGKAKEVTTVSHQVDDNKRLVDRLGPRIQALSQKLTGVEVILQKGDIDAVVNDAAKVAMSDVLRDMNRGMYQLLRK